MSEQEVGSEDVKDEVDQEPPLFFIRHPSTWSVGEVGLFLKRLNLREYADAFKDHQIDGSTLLLWTKDDFSVWAEYF